jgi:5-formyltetrahydrofolate cyclo-ligase
MTEKATLRRWLREQLRLLSPAEKAAASERLCEQLQQEPAWSKSRRVFGFVPLPSEPDYLSALQSHQELFVPRTCAEGLQFFSLFAEDSMKPPLVKNPRGWPGVGHVIAGEGMKNKVVRCWEPAAEGAPMRPAEGDIILVPGLGFTPAGERLGRGGGYYDRFLARIQASAISTWGVAFSCQLLPSLPMESHDLRVTRVLVG